MLSTANVGRDRIFPIPRTEICRRQPRSAVLENHNTAVGSEQSLYDWISYIVFNRSNSLKFNKSPARSDNNRCFLRVSPVAFYPFVPFIINTSREDPLLYPDIYCLGVVRTGRRTGSATRRRRADADPAKLAWFRFECKRAVYCRDDELRKKTKIIEKPRSTISNVMFGTAGKTSDVKFP